MRPRIVVVDDEPSIVFLVQKLLEAHADVVGAASAEDGWERLREAPADALITDLRLPGMDGVALARRASREMPSLPIIGASGDTVLPELAELLRLGMVDFLVKPFSGTELRMAVQRALAWRGLLRDAPACGPDPPSDQAFAPLVGAGELLSALKASALAAAASPAPLLIEGPSGTGKSLLARAIHEASPRRDAPLVEIACAALPDSLLEVELFGHVAGSFTGADRDRPGAFERALSGTVVLDELPALSERAAARIVRAVAAGEVTRVGEDRPRKVTARIIATSQRALEPLVDAGAFRADLYHAIGVLRLRTPALCELPASDVGAIASHLLERTCIRMKRPRPALDPSFVEAAAGLPWPGNVRELDNALERAVLLGDGEAIGAADLVAVDAPARGRRIELPERGLDLHATLAAIEAHHLARALERTGGNKQQAAGLLGLTRTGLVQKLRRSEGRS